MIFQSYALWPHMTVAENIVLRLAASQDQPRDDREEARLDFEDHQARSARAALSRRAVGRATTTRRAGACFDRRAGDAVARRTAVQSRCQFARRDALRDSTRLHDEYRYTTVYVTHDQSEAMTTADLIAVMNSGKIDQLGTPEDIYDRPQSEFVAAFHWRQQRYQRHRARPQSCFVLRRDLAGGGAKLTAGQSAAIAIRPARHLPFDGDAASVAKTRSRPS